MTLTTEVLGKYLGRSASEMLSERPFNKWPYERSVEEGLDEPEIDYVFQEHGMDILCDEDESINTIFLYSDDHRRFSESIEDLPFSLRRQQVAELFGHASKSGGRAKDAVLGERGAWDRFARRGYSIHIEYRSDADRISRITLMRSDVVP